MPDPLTDAILPWNRPSPWKAAQEPYGPQEPPPEPPPLTGWRGVVDQRINGLVGGFKGLTGVGDQGPAGPTAINAGQVLGAAMPFLGGLGFSRLAKAAEGLPKSTFGGKIASIAQKGLASGEEMAVRNVPTFLEKAGAKPIAKEAFQEHLAAHPLPEINVKTLGEPQTRLKVVPTSELEARPDYYGPSADVSPWTTVDSATGHPYSHHQTNGAAHDYIQEFSQDAGSANPTKFSQYQLPGGKNYRETLFTTPHPDTTAYEAKVKQLKADLGPHYHDLLSSKDQRELDALGNKAYGDEGKFQSSHFDTNNILVHTRSNERELPGIGKGHFLEEVQSDWHQKGKEEGYKQPNTPASQEALEQAKVNYERLYALHHTLEQEMGAMPRGTTANEIRAQRERTLAAYTQRQQAYDALHDLSYPGQSKGVPDAPFKDTWPDLALKHHLVEAAQNPDTNWLGFTGGKTQADRYDLSKQIKAVHWYPERGTLETIQHGHAHPTEMASGVTPEKLADYIGKEAAKKLVDAPVMAGGAHVLTGLDLSVGGEGMHEFYDNLLPRRLQKIVGPFGGKVERTSMPIPRAGKTGMNAAPAPTSADGWMVRLTPELKAKILKMGVPFMAGVAATQSDNSK